MCRCTRSACPLRHRSFSWPLSVNPLRNSATKDLQLHKSSNTVGRRFFFILFIIPSVHRLLCNRFRRCRIPSRSGTETTIVQKKKKIPEVKEFSQWQDMSFHFTDSCRIRREIDRETHIIYTIVIN